MRGCHLENMVSCSFIIKGRMERVRRPPSSSLLRRHQASIINSFSKSGGEFSCPYMVKPGLSWHNGNEQKGGNIH